MSKNLFNIIAFFCLLCSNAQTTTFIYKKIASNEENSKRDDYLDQITSFVKEVTYELNTNGKESYFFAQDKMYSPKFNKHAISYSGGKTVYAIANREKIHFYEQINNNTIVGDSIAFSEWNISNETKIINGYLCYKATKETKYNAVKVDEKTDTVSSIPLTKELTAWFCPEFPFSFGPAKYLGLPGIVFEAYETNGRISFVLIEIKKTIHKISKLDTKKVISKKEQSAAIIKNMNGSD